MYVYMWMHYDSRTTNNRTAPHNGSDNAVHCDWFYNKWSKNNQQLTRERPLMTSDNFLRFFTPLPTMSNDFYLLQHLIFRVILDPLPTLKSDVIIERSPIDLSPALKKIWCLTGLMIWDRTMTTIMWTRRGGQVVQNVHFRPPKYIAKLYILRWVGVQVLGSYF